MAKVMEISDVRLKWRKRGFSCDAFNDPPGQSWETFVHKCDELLMPVEGEIEVEIVGIIYHPAIGQELYIPKNSIHSVRNVGKGMSLWLYGYNGMP